MASNGSSQMLLWWMPRLKVPQQRGNRIRKRKAISIFRIQHARTAGEARSMAARSREQIPSADSVVG